MSSYRGAGGPWDDGPPGAEGDYGQPGPAPYTTPASTAPLQRTMPTTDPWTGVSYSQYAPPSYDYQAYGTAGYGYGYDAQYYQASDGRYYGKYPESQSGYPPPEQTYNYQQTSRDKSRTPESRNYQRRRSYQSNSRSVSPYESRERAYSHKRDGSHEDGNRRKRSRSESSRSKHKYSSSDRSSSRSRSYSRSTRKNKKKGSVSSESSASERSSKNKCDDNKSNGSLTPPPLKKMSSPVSHRSRDSCSVHMSKSRSPSVDKTDYKHKNSKPHYSKLSFKDMEKTVENIKKERHDPSTPPTRISKIGTKLPGSPSGSRKNTNQSVSSFKSYKNRKGTPPRKMRKSSMTPPKSYRSRSHSSSKSRSNSPARRFCERSDSTDSHRSRSRSSTSRSSCHSRSSRRTRRTSKNKSPSRLRSRRSGSRRRSRSRGTSSPKRSVSQGRSRSRSRTASDDERRGQFTVADRKRFWQLHRSRQEERPKTPPKEIKLPPGVVESSHIDDIEYGDPPDVEGPNFAELLPTPEQVMQHASTSKSKPVPIPIKNDGSFLEMFKKMQQETKKSVEVEKKVEMKKPILPFIGKRRGGRVLKTGLVKKAKAIDEQAVDNAPKDAWSLYMQEVKKYRETSCEEERKTRPLVK